MITTAVKIDPKMKTLIDGLKKIDQGVKDTAWEGMLGIAYQMEADIKKGIPVDTGRARASWGHFTPEDLTGVSKKVKSQKVTQKTRITTGRGVGSGRIQTASAADAIWEEDKSKQSVTQGTYVPYTRWLDEPAQGRPGLAFIATAYVRALRSYDKLSKSIEKTIMDLLNGRKPSFERITSFRFRVPGAGGERKTYRL